MFQFWKLFRYVTSRRDGQKRNLINMLGFKSYKSLNWFMRLKFLRLDITYFLDEVVIPPNGHSHFNEIRESNQTFFVFQQPNSVILISP